jgi:hypothetical protein
MKLFWSIVFIAMACGGCGGLAQWNARMHGAQPTPSASLVACPEGQVFVNGCCQKGKAQ